MTILYFVKLCTYGQNIDLFRNQPMFSPCIRGRLTIWKLGHCPRARGQ
ncbi:unnamed protein product [Staurois parvus]|uniref:Uncharacterized protein n=1 Tax=Staurois parvus TaxID=386267 RepID=A0ABN9ADY3_9NEOB|nr:unnamed protein product [Staurois parvus]